MRIATPYLRLDYKCERTICDICGQDTWQPEHGNACQVEIEARIGDAWEMDSRKVTTLDCCVMCWKTKVVPALQAIGAKFRTYDAEDGDKVVIEHGPVKP